MMALQGKHLIQWVQDVFPSVQSSTRRRSDTVISLKTNRGHHDYITYAHVR